MLVREVAVPASLERLEHGLPLFGEVHLLGADDQGHLEQARFDGGEALEQARAGAGAGVVRIEDRNALKAIGAQRGLAADAVLAIIDLPQSAPPEPLADSVVVLDAVQDPGNLGTILRTAAAAGIGRVLLGAGCAQAWSPRVLRAAMGAHFVLEIEDGIDACARLKGYPGRCLATALGQGASALYGLDLRRPVALLFGAVGQGLSADLLACADQRVIIPMAAGVESLNVGAAVAVCLFEQARQMRAR